MEYEGSSKIYICTRMYVVSGMWRYHYESVCIKCNVTLPESLLPGISLSLLMLMVRMNAPIAADPVGLLDLSGLLHLGVEWTELHTQIQFRSNQRFLLQAMELKSPEFPSHTDTYFPHDLHGVPKLPPMSAARASPHLPQPSRGQSLPQ